MIIYSLKYVNTRIIVIKKYINYKYKNDNFKCVYMKMKDSKNEKIIYT